MKLTALPTGQLAVNTYFIPLGSPLQGRAVSAPKGLTPVLVVDPGDDGGSIVAALKANAFEPLAVGLTHHHFDHVLGLPAVLDAFPGIRVGSFEPPLVQNAPTPDTVFTEGATLDCLVPEQSAEIRQEAASWRVLHTPGHTADSVCFYNEAEKMLISGDTLFWQTYGRTDLPGGSDEQIAQSLNRLFTLPQDTLVYPGHDRCGFTLASDRFLY
jgi:glyoxylase-like metal-dependent hydrolase (beta-lactamase superfamily II)